MSLNAMISIKKAGFKQKELVYNLMQFCIYDYSSYDEIDIDSKGQYKYKYLDKYFKEKDRFPFIIYFGEKIAGLALVRINIKKDSYKYNSIAEFFIMNQYKGRGIGQKTVEIIFNKFKGKWIVDYDLINKRGQAFWKKVVSEYTDNNFRTGIDKIYHHELLIFEN